MFQLLDITDNSLNVVRDDDIYHHGDSSFNDDDGGGGVNFSVRSETTAPTIDDSSWEAAVFVCSRYIMPSVCLFGILGNAINLTILTRRSMRRSSPYAYLLGLAVTDVTVLSLSLVDFLLSGLLQATSYWSVVFNAFVFYPMSNVFSSSSVWITVLLTVERYVSVRYPLKAKELCTRKLARRTICLVVVLASVFNVPRFFGYEIRDCGHGRYEKVSSTFEASPSFGIMTWFYICTVHFLPYLLLSYLNAGLILTVFRANRQRSALRCISRSFKSLSATSNRLDASSVTGVNRVSRSRNNDSVGGGSSSINDDCSETVYNNNNNNNNNSIANGTNTGVVKTRQKITKMFNCRTSTVANADVEVFQMKEVHHHHHHHHHHQHHHYHNHCHPHHPHHRRNPLSPSSPPQSSTHLPLPFLQRLQQRQISEDSNSGSTVQSQSRPSCRCLGDASRLQPSNSVALLTQAKGKVVKLFPRRSTNYELYVVAPPTRNASCISLPGDARHRRFSMFARQAVSIHGSISFPSQQQRQDRQLQQQGQLLQPIASRQQQQRQQLERRVAAAAFNSGRQQATYFSNEQMRMTITCISIICLFLVCIIPSAFSNRPIAKALFGHGLTMVEFTRGRFYNRLRTATNFLVYCNLSLNFVLYCVFNHRFLVTLRRLVDQRMRKIASAFDRRRRRSRRRHRDRRSGDSCCRCYRRRFCSSGDRSESTRSSLFSCTALSRRRSLRADDCSSRSSDSRRCSCRRSCPIEASRDRAGSLMEEAEGGTREGGGGEGGGQVEEIEGFVFTFGRQQKNRRNISVDAGDSRDRKSRRGLRDDGCHSE